MKQTPPTAKFIESYMEELVVKKNNLEPISGTPTHSKVKPLFDAMDKNLIHTNDDRDTVYGKLPLVTNTSHLVGGSVQQVVPSTNQGRLPPYLAPTTTQERHNFVTRFYKNQQYWLEDVNAEEADKKFIISIVDAVHLEPLWEPRF